MPSPVSFNHTNSGFQAGTINGQVNTTFQLPPTPNDLLESLQTAEAAPFNSYQRQYDPTCLRDTRVDLLQKIYDWADGRDNQGIFWLNSLAGTGKSTIARTVARHYYGRRLAASFFFSRGGGDVGHAGRFVTSIAVQLAGNLPVSRQYICNAVEERKDIASQSLRDQWHHLIIKPLMKLDGPSSYVLVVDALDECDDENSIRTIVELLAEARSLKGVQLRVFLTSRPEVPIRHGFGLIPQAEHRDFVLHQISPSTVDHDIFIFLEYNLQLIARERCLGVGWPGTDVIARLVQSASGLFIWAATACRFIQEGIVTDRLDAILNDSILTVETSTDESSAEDSDMNTSPTLPPKSRLNSMYLVVLKSPTRKYTKQERKKWYRMVRKWLGAVVLLFSPLPTSSFASLLDVSTECSTGSRSTAPPTSPFISRLVPRQKSDAAMLISGWTGSKRIKPWGDKCIKLMSKSLRQDICVVNSLGRLVSEVEKAKIEQHLSLELQYA